MNLTLKIPQQTVSWTLLILIGIILALNVHIINKDNSIVGADSPNHLFSSMQFYHHLQDILTNKTQSFLQKYLAMYRLISNPGMYGGVYWPNGLNVVTTVFYHILQPSLFAAKISLLPFMFILLTATFYIGKHYGTTLSGLLASYILLSYPIIFESSRQYQLDFPLTAMVALTIALLLKSNHFKNTLYSFLAGCSLGGALLIKGQAIIFIAVPLAIIIAHSLHNLGKNAQVKQKIKFNILLFALWSLAFASFWWINKIGAAEQELLKHIFLAKKAFYEGYLYNTVGKFSSIFFPTFYLRATIWAMGPLALVVFLLVSLTSKEAIYAKAICFSWAMVSFLIFSFVFLVKTPRFLMPILPAIACITSWQIGKIKRNSFLIILIVIITGLLQFYGFSYAGWGKLPRVQKTYKYLPESGYTSKPKIHEHNLKAVAQAIKTLKRGNQALKVGIVCTGELDTFEVLYWLSLYAKNLYLVDLVQDPKRFAEEFDSLDAIIFSKHPRYKYSAKWPEGQALWKLLLRRFPTRTEIQNTENSSLWKQLMFKFSQVKGKFSLSAEVQDEETGYNTYYVYAKLSDKQFLGKSRTSW